MTSFEGRATSIMGDLVQILDGRSGHSLFLSRQQIDGHADLALDDRVWIEGETSRRRGRRIAGTAPVRDPSAT